jgi:hypothetical protein
MRRGWYLRAVITRHVHLQRPSISAIAVALVCLCAAACSTNNSLTLNAMTLNSATPRASVAFEQIDGPPQGVFRQLVHDLSQEAEARQIAVVSHEQAAQFRVRGYVAAHVREGHTTIAWVWDVYDGEQRRALRISGEEDAGATHGDAWTAMDDQVLRRISRSSMDRLVAFLGSAPQDAPQEARLVASADTATADEHNSPGQVFTIAATRDEFAPESFGIYRLPNAQNAASTGETDAPAHGDIADVPLPRPRPIAIGTLALASH